MTERTTVRVETTTVDRFCRNEGIERIDLLKLDVQGAELAILEGAAERLRSHRVSMVLCEVLTCPTYEGQHKLHEYLARMDGFGYGPYDFFGQVRNRTGRLLCVDVLFLAPEMMADY